MQWFLSSPLSPASVFSFYYYHYYYWLIFYSYIYCHFYHWLIYFFQPFQMSSSYFYILLLLISIHLFTFTVTTMIFINFKFINLIFFSIFFFLILFMSFVFFPFLYLLHLTSIMNHLFFVFKKIAPTLPQAASAQLEKQMNATDITAWYGNALGHVTPNILLSVLSNLLHTTFFTNAVCSLFPIVCLQFFSFNQRMILFMNNNIYKYSLLLLLII